jgi:transcriptional regulator with XRE-family HTH domain
LHLSREAIGSRLQEERKRIGLNQDDFAQRIGVAKRTLAGYESGTGEVGAAALAMASELGVDVLYVVTGELKPVAESILMIEELELVLNYRQLPELDRAGANRMITALAETAARKEVKKG